jgi:hypothetical protein
MHQSHPLLQICSQNGITHQAILEKVRKTPHVQEQLVPSLEDDTRDYNNVA